MGGGNGMGGVCVVCGDGRNNINVWLMGRQLQGEFREKIDNNYLRSYGHANYRYLWLNSAEG